MSLPASAITPKKRRRRIWIIVAAVVVVLALIAVLFAVRAGNRRGAASGDITAVVSRGAVSASVTASGQTVDEYTYSVAPGVSAVLTQRDGVAVNGSSSSSAASTAAGSTASSSGSGSSGGASSSGYQTTSLSVAIGDTVHANETIATATSQGTRASDLEASVTNAKATVDNAYAALSNDQSTYTSLTTATPAATTQSLNAAKKQIQQDYLTITTAKSSLSLANENLAARIVAVNSPVDGYIQAIPTAVGASATQVATIGAGAREISVMVSEYDISRVLLGQKVDVTLGSSTSTFVGNVVRMSPVPNSSTGVEQYQVVVGSASIPSTARIGMTVTAAIEIASHQNVLNVPASAITVSNGRSVVTVVTARGQQVVTPVKLGLIGNSSVEILSGLTAGETIVVGAAGTVPATTTTIGPGRGL